MADSEVPAVLRQFGATPLAAVQGAIRSQHAKFRSAVKRAAKRIGRPKESRKIDGKTMSVDYLDDNGDSVTETAAKMLMLLQANPVAVGDEVVRTWLGQSQGEWHADAAADWHDYVIDHPSIAGATYAEKGRHSFEPVTMTIVIGALIALAPVVLPILLSMVQDFFKSEQDKANDARDAQVKADEAIAAQQKAKDQQTTMIIGGVVAVLAVGGLVVFYVKFRKKAA